MGKPQQAVVCIKPQQRIVKTHSKYDRTNALHPYKVDGSGKHPYFPVDRNAFDKDRKQYWKDRAKAEKRRRRKAGKC